jgi:hypothetical protein
VDWCFASSVSSTVFALAEWGVGFAYTVKVAGGSAASTLATAMSRCMCRAGAVGTHLVVGARALDDLLADEQLLLSRLAWVGVHTSLGDAGSGSAMGLPA